MLVTPVQVKAARAILGWTKEKLAEAADVGLQSVHRMEMGREIPKRGTQKLILAALRQAGVDFPDAMTIRLPPEHAA